jgi:hypothetical protein
VPEGEGGQATEQPPQASPHDSWEPGNPRFASLEEIQSRLEGATPEAAKGVFEAVKVVLDAEQKRAPVIDARATSMLGAAGLSMSVIFTFGTYLVKKDLGLNGVESCAVVALYVLALLSGILSALLSLLVLFVRDDHPVADENAIFRREALVPPATECTYRNQLSVHFWSIYQYLTRKHVRKARRLRWAQTTFMVFLVLVSFLGGVIAMSSAKNSTQNTQNTKMTTITSPSTSQPDPSPPATSSVPPVLPPIQARLIADSQDAGRK